MDLHSGRAGDRHSTCHPPLVALGMVAPVGAAGQGVTRLCPVRGDSCVPSEPAQPLLHHQNTNEPNLALFQPQVLPGEQRFVQDHGTAPGTRLHKKVLSPRSVCVGEGTQGFGGQRDLLQLGRFAHEPAVN